MPSRPSTLSLLFDLFVANQRVRTLLESAMRGAGMRADEYAVYSAVFDRGPIAPTELARRLAIPPTTLTHYLDAMRAARHLRQARNPGDGRSYLVRLSPAGLAAHRRASAAFELAYAPFLAQLHDPDGVRVTLRAIAVAAEGAMAEMAGSHGVRAG